MWGDATHSAQQCNSANRLGCTHACDPAVHVHHPAMHAHHPAMPTLPCMPTHVALPRSLLRAGAVAEAESERLRQELANAQEDAEEHRERLDRLREDLASVRCDGGGRGFESHRAQQLPLHYLHISTRPSPTILPPTRQPSNTPTRTHGQPRARAQPSPVLHLDVHDMCFMICKCRWRARSMMDQKDRHIERLEGLLRSHGVRVPAPPPEAAVVPRASTQADPHGTPPEMPEHSRKGEGGAGVGWVEWVWDVSTASATGRLKEPLGAAPTLWLPLSQQ